MKSEGKAIFRHLLRLLLENMLQHKNRKRRDFGNKVSVPREKKEGESWDCE